MAFELNLMWCRTLVANVVLLGLLTSSCSNVEESFYREESKNEPFGVKYNQIRTNLGIPLLPPDWFTEETSIKPKGFLKLRRYDVNYWGLKFGVLMMSI